ncbi:MAG: amylo-alpha-1,6-glucosidase [Spirochaetaceae bacterium]|nr:MAG: amylo-alpha-1,6-glucosidase [Spirochaetaceae bacterium]
MDLSRNVVLKENYTFFVGDPDVQVLPGGEHGLYNRDTRFLSRYQWIFDRTFQTLRVYSQTPDTVDVHYAAFTSSFQTVGIRRRTVVDATSLVDELVVENTGTEPASITIALEADCDFADMFETREWQGSSRGEIPVTPIDEGSGIRFRYIAEDGLGFQTVVVSNTPVHRLKGRRFEYLLDIQPSGSSTLSVRVRIENPLEDDCRAVTYQGWRSTAPLGHADMADTGHQRVLERAVDDLRALLLFTPEGCVPAAGIPWFVCAFGRDSLLTAMFLLPWWREPAEGTLRYLSRHQAVDYDEYRASSPGKIFHELRFGELSRTGKVPFGPYYGTIDATPLFVMLLADLIRVTDDHSIVHELRPAWEAALVWLEKDGDPDGDGFLEYMGSAVGDGQGLPIQSWKDSDDSMSHADGSLAEGPIAPCEAQGYAYRALLSGADLYDVCGEHSRAEAARERARTLKSRFHAAFWLDGLGTYAMALDGDKRALAVKSSNVGHLLWTGIVPESHSQAVRDALFDSDLWTGWGFRTLGRGERRYNPVSYHNGSVWPHDTAIAAKGLARYGFVDEAVRVRTALYDIAAGQSDLRLPELVAGYDRSAGPPIPYPVACRPQAWDSGALIYLLDLNTAT